VAPGATRVTFCLCSDGLGPLTVCDHRGIGVNQYEDIIYDDLFSLIDGLLKLPEDPETIQVASKNSYIFMQDNTSCYKSIEVLEFL